jgi:hypothetical protein
MAQQARTSLHSHLSKTIAVLVAIFVLHIAGSAEGQKVTPDTLLFRSPLPLGADAYELKPLNRRFFLMASADNPEFNKCKVTRAHLGGTVIGADGTEMRHYPEQLSFRVTASAIESEMLPSDIDPVNYKGDMNSFLLGLKFRLKVYRGLKMNIVQPERVHLAGVPADLPFDERVYKIAFDTNDLPLDARLVLEVFGPDGEPLSRFHLEML